MERGDDGQWRFRIPLRMMIDALSEVGKFPVKVNDVGAERTWDGPTLFIKGAKSKCVGL